MGGAGEVHEPLSKDIGRGFVECACRFYMLGVGSCEDIHSRAWPGGRLGPTTSAYVLLFL